MSISSDVSKQSLTQLHTGTDVQSNAREFQEVQKKEAQVIKKSVDITPDKDAKNTFENELSNATSEEILSFEESQTDEVNLKMRQLNVSLSFELSEEGGDNVVKVIDRETGDLVRQIPTEEFLKISKRIDDIFEEVSDLKGSLVNSEV
ncbi:flagellar biosynthesis protein FlaG [Marinomonas mediterranea]|uniref:Flagellar protein FlaG protein n=1 Tax=Marinomonas mediterranea (strain ATCC 700492 / JCM 21426 / NBRC 103028 / MMB-1) TaxID=717774 RepID=F2K4S7_MARM1|nr:flagellar protein FlaG [Marinomonas mediterranea]ADZ92570.1 flagellar protein FlaG protein [Marinomonas mediterranea MMB-1]WCN14564.1 flagellar biosynthesis protein FlaG [Marinomonas mediterranea]WCN18613.1 flagellar biosynthesis protein FlaG [Marinomonas mediterranea MMB-1]